MEKTSTSSESNKTGIYFLIYECRVVYIGKTTQYPFRLKHHHRQNMIFSSCKFIPCDNEKLAYYEKRWIERFRPIYNHTYKHKRKNAIPETPEHRRGKKVIRYTMKFRKLTRLSRIGFGFYADRQVGNMMDCKKYVDLAQMYFNLSHITFFDDILDEIGITQEWRINKPGNDRQKGFEFAHAVYPDEMVKRKQNKEQHNYQESKAALKQIFIKTKSRAYHQNKNQH